MLKKYIETGRIVGTHGVRGAVRVQPWCDSADFIAGFNSFYTSPDGGEALKCVRIAIQGKMALMWFDGLDSIESAAKLKGKILYLKREDVVLEDGKYLIQDIIGCKAFDAETQKEYGVISDVFETGANDVWEIKKDGREYLIPVIESIVKAVDVNNRRVLIAPIKGIFDED